MNWAFETEAKGPAKLVLLSLAHHWNEKGKASWPGLNRIAHETALGRRTVIRAIDKLEELDLIEKATREGSHGQNRYTLSIPSETSAEVDSSRGASRDTSTEIVEVPPVHGRSANGDSRSATAMAPKPLSSEPLSKNRNHPPSSSPSFQVGKGEESNGGRSLGNGGRSVENGTSPKSRAWPSPEALAALYNEQTPDECLAVGKLTPGRIKKANKYLAMFPNQSFWQEVFAEIHRSRFLRGLNNRLGSGHENFRASFDWLLTVGKDGTENCVKVSEGRYREREEKAMEPPWKRFEKEDGPEQSEFLQQVGALRN